MPRGKPKIEARADLDLPDALGFLKPFLSSDPDRYRRSEWLKSEFSSPTWVIKLDSTFSISWEVIVGNSGLSLTSPRHKDLLNFFKLWLVVQTHPDATGYVYYADRSAYNTIRRVIALIDLILLNADRLGVTGHGPAALTEGAWRAIIQRLSTNSESSEAVYSWSERLSAYLRRELNTERKEDLEGILAELPALATLDVPRDEWLADLTEIEVPLVRAMLWRRGQYLRIPHSEYQYQPAVTAIATAIYSNTLCGAKALLPVPRELCFGESTHRLREFRAIPVTMDDSPRRSKKDVARIIRCIDHANLLRGMDAAPEVDASSLEALLAHLDLKSHQRFRSLPPEEGFRAMRRGVELFIEYGEDVRAAFARLTEASQETSTSFGELSQRLGIRHFVSDKLIRLGVQHWSISACFSRNSTNDSFFDRVRENHGLLELMRVMAGGAQTVIGALSARRADELLKLKSGSALDADGTRLVFGVGKKNLGQRRKTEARPIPPIAVEMIEHFECLHATFADSIGLRRDQLYIFSPVLIGGGFSLNPPRGQMFYRVTDLFCDYIQTARDEEGRRHYIRQHQLRRWFAMLFFWANSFGGSETLRWFLAHTDMQHLYHYVTEAVPGAVLRSAAAGWATSAVLADRPETKCLSDLIGHHFGTHDFRLIDSRRLEVFLETLLEDGKVEVEPIFFDFGRRCEIGVKIRENIDGQAG